MVAGADLTLFPGVHKRVALAKGMKGGEMSMQDESNDLLVELKEEKARREVEVASCREAERDEHTKYVTMDKTT